MREELPRSRRVPGRGCHGSVSLGFLKDLWQKSQWDLGQQWVSLDVPARYPNVTLLSVLCESMAPSGDGKERGAVIISDSPITQQGHSRRTTLRSLPCLTSFYSCSHHKYPGENEKQQGVCWLSPRLLPHLPPLLSPSSTLLGSPLPLVPLLGFALETFSLFQPTLMSSHDL